MATTPLVKRLCLFCRKPFFTRKARLCSSVCKKRQAETVQILFHMREKVAEEIAKMLPEFWLAIVNKMSKKLRISHNRFGNIYKAYMLGVFKYYPRSGVDVVLYNKSEDFEKVSKMVRDLYSKLPVKVKSKISMNLAKSKRMTPHVMAKWRKGILVADIAKELNITPKSVKSIIVRNS